jgi:hypothetical protein
MLNKFFYSSLLTFALMLFFANYPNPPDWLQSLVAICGLVSFAAAIVFLFMKIWTA